MRTTPEGGAGGTSLRARPNNTGTPAITTASPTTGKLYIVCCKVSAFFIYLYKGYFRDIL